MPNAPIDKGTGVPVHMVFAVAILIGKVIVNHYFEQGGSSNYVNGLSSDTTQIEVNKKSISNEMYQDDLVFALT